MGEDMPEGLNEIDKRVYRALSDGGQMPGVSWAIDALHRLADAKEGAKVLQLDANRWRGDYFQLKESLQKIHMIRCHIVASGGGHWSRDVYPLVAILEKTGFPAVNAGTARKILENCDCVFCKNKREAEEESTGDKE